MLNALKGRGPNTITARIDTATRCPQQSAKLPEIFYAHGSTDCPFAMVFVRKDLAGFYGLMINNLIQLILIVSLYRELIYLPDSYMFGKILSGRAISILFGNCFYAKRRTRLFLNLHPEDTRDLSFTVR